MSWACRRRRRDRAPGRPRRPGPRAAAPAAGPGTAAARSTTAAETAAASSPGTTYARYTGIAVSSSVSTAARSARLTPSRSGSRLAGQPGQPGHLGREGLAGLLALGGLGHAGEPGGPGGEALVGGGQRGGAGRVEEQAADHAQRVVAGGPGARPVGGQPLGPGQDLLGGYPAAAGTVREPPQVAARVGQAVRVVHPQPVDEALVHQAEDHLVGGLEHGRVLDPDRDQRADVEEPAPVQLRRRQVPVGQPVMLGLQQLASGRASVPGRTGNSWSW